MRRFRFHLASLFAGALAAAVLLGLNLAPLMANRQEPPMPGMFSCWGPGIRTIDLPETQRHSAFVRISQGWPLSVREEDAIVRGSSLPLEYLDQRQYSLGPTHWSWSTEISIDWRRVALNGGIALLLALGVLFVTEKLLRRRGPTA